MEIQGQIKSCRGHPVGMRGDLCLGAANGHSVPFVKWERERDAEGWWGNRASTWGRSPVQFRGGIPGQMLPSPGLGWMGGSGWQWLGTWMPSLLIYTLWQVAVQPFLRLITGRESTFNPSVRLSEEVSVFMFPWGQEHSTANSSEKAPPFLSSWGCCRFSLCPTPTFSLVELLLPCSISIIYYFSLADAVCSSGRYRLSNKMDKYWINCVSSVFFFPQVVIFNFSKLKLMDSKE